ncbi:MAG: tripartite tricarboxylate transporter TctB family protein [Rhodospirillales bacterium]|nr:tripartite tricarboxylate transporter TctB family protein [Rhodospirillales bacterium]
MNGHQNASQRLQQIIPPGIVVAFSLWIAFVSFNVDDPQPYLFPRLISIALVGLSLLALIRAFLGKDNVGAGFTKAILKNVAAGVAVMGLFVFFLAEFLGFYTASALTFLVIVSLYDPASHYEIQTWVKRFGVMIGFIAIMYGLFTLLLKVQIPKGLFL